MFIGSTPGLSEARLLMVGRFIGDPGFDDFQISKFEALKELQMLKPNIEINLSSSKTQLFFRTIPSSNGEVIDKVDQSLRFSREKQKQSLTAQHWQNVCLSQRCECARLQPTCVSNVSRLHFCRQETTPSGEIKVNRQLNFHDHSFS